MSDTPDPQPDAAEPKTDQLGATRAEGIFDAAATPAAQEVARNFGPYEVLGVLGRGGMGVVYRARQVSLGRMIALKVLPAEFQDDAESVGRFQREAKTAANLQHANLVRVFTAGEAEGCHFIAMELIEGENLHQRLRRERLSIVESLRICAEVARGLQFAWESAQLIHRDIKPSNIYLSGAGEVKVGDLGLAKSMSAMTTGLTQTGTMMGTPYYMSPEQGRGDKALDFRADIYSLGCTFFEMLTGQPPYRGDDPLSIIHQHINAPLPAILKVMPHCPILLVRIVGRMLKKGKHERYASCEELIGELDWVREQIEQGTLGRAPGTSTVGQAPRLPVGATPPPAAGGAPALQAPSKRTLWIGIAAGVLVLGGLAFMLVQPGKPKAKTSTAVAQTQKPAAPAAPRLSASTEPWVDRMPEVLAAKYPDTHGEAGGRYFKTHTQVALKGDMTDGAIRLLFAPGAEKQTIVTLRNGASTGSYMLHTHQEVRLSITEVPKGVHGLGPEVKYPSPDFWQPGKPIEVEFRAVGSKLTGKINGQVMIEKEDTQHTAGIYFVQVGPGTLLYAVQTLDLSKPAPVVTQTPLPPGGLPLPEISDWEDVMQRVKDYRNSAGAKLFTEENGWLVAAGDKDFIRVGLKTLAGTAVRGRMRGRSDVAIRGSLRGHYNVSLRADGNGFIGQHSLETARTTYLTRFTLSKAPEHEFLVTMTGPDLRVWVDGTLAATARDTKFESGGVSIGFPNAGSAIRDLAIAELPAGFFDQPPAAASDEQWTDGLAPMLASEPLVSWMEKVGAGVRVTKFASFVVCPKVVENVAVRVTTRGETAPQRVTFHMRRPKAAGSNLGDGYRADIGSLGGRFNGRITSQTGDQSTELKTFDMPAGFSLSERHTIEFRAHGEVLTLVVDGQEIASVKDSAFRSGDAMLLGSPGMVFEKAEWRELGAR